jgi:TrmH family RNA methyltransferase
LPHACLVLLGNEGAGLPDDLVAQADVRVAVPMRPGVDSLNVAVTAALILDAVRRAGLARTRGPS